MKYIPHEIADIFPMMIPSEFVALKQDIKERGLKNPVILFEGKILDGRNRFKACQEVGAHIETVEYTGDNAAKDVISWNLHRRHLNESQRAMVAAKLANLPAHRPSYKSANLPTSSSKDLLCPACGHIYSPSNEICHVCGYDLVKDCMGEKESRISQPEAAQMLNVSERSLRTAKKVEQNAIPEIIEKVEQGIVSVSAASNISKMDKSDQKEINENINKGEKPIEAMKKKSRNEEIINPHSTALQFSAIAICQLERIKKDDVKRVEAFNTVINFINLQLKL